MNKQNQTKTKHIGTENRIVIISEGKGLGLGVRWRLVKYVKGEELYGDRWNEN